jgi:hypothetical protein
MCECPVETIIQRQRVRARALSCLHGGEFDEGSFSTCYVSWKIRRRLRQFHEDIECLERSTFPGEFPHSHQLPLHQIAAGIWLAGQLEDRLRQLLRTVQIEEHCCAVY